MKRKFYTTVLVGMTIVMAMFSCKGKKNAPSDNVWEDQAHKDSVLAIADSSIHVRLKTVNGDSITVVDYGANKQYTLDYARAEQEGRVRGSLTRNDTLAVVPDFANRRINSSVNVSELEGQWFYDLKNGRGLRFEYGGGMSPINTDDMSYREWQVVNDQLRFRYVEMQQKAETKEEFCADMATIQLLSRERLVLKLRGKTLDCRRQHKAIMFKI